MSVISRRGRMMKARGCLIYQGPHLSPGTSSSGNGVALASGFCSISIGSETDGSITLPCLASGLYGIKPTTGLVSRSGMVPFARSFDTPGPMGRDVYSVALGLDAISGEDEEDELTLGIPRLPAGSKVSSAFLVCDRMLIQSKYIDSCTASTLEGLRVGVPREVSIHCLTDSQ